MTTWGVGPLPSFMYSTAKPTLEEYISRAGRALRPGRSPCRAPSGARPRAPCLDADQGWELVGTSAGRAIAATRCDLTQRLLGKYVRPVLLPLLVASQVLFGRLVDSERLRPRLELVVGGRITEDGEPVRDRPIDLGVPELLFTLGRRPPEELADSFPGQAECGEHGGDAGADRTLGPPDYETDASKGEDDCDDQQGRESCRDLLGGLPQLACHTVGS